MFDTIAITTRREVENKKMFRDIIEFLLSQGKKVFLSSHARENLDGEFLDLPPVDYSKKFDLLIAYGGDGTILRAARNLQHLDTAILGINGGHLGFLASVGKIHWKEDLEDILRGKHRKVFKSVCKVSLERNKKIIMETKVLNDAVVSYKNVARLITVDAFVNGIELCKYKADGLIVSTPTGSTAYNLAAGGPIVYPSLRVNIITPICSHSFTQKPVVIPGDRPITLEFTENDEVLNLTLDGQRSVELQKNDRVTIVMMETPLMFLKKEDDNFFQTIREKLHWGLNIR